MKLKKAEIFNKGMVQDYSISKQSQEYAYKNYNIKIHTEEGCTSMSITNILGPEYKNIDLQGIVLGKCILDDYIVLFTTSSTSSYTPDRIYRLDFSIVNGVENFVLNELFCGDLNFNKDFLIDTTFFIENSNVIKVYWTDGLNNPRFINIITEGERVSDNKVFTPYTNGAVFDFYPKVQYTPKISLQKEFKYDSELPNGVVLYFVSYYKDNGAETALLSSSHPITLDYLYRGAKGDDPLGNCCITLTISNIDTSFDYIRIYSVIRTSEYGEVITKIVKDIKIFDLNTVTVVDDGKQLEVITFEQLLYTGGLQLIAKTLTLKDGTLFLGNLKRKITRIPNNVYDYVNEIILQHNQHIYGNSVNDIFSNLDLLISSPFIEFLSDKKINTLDKNNNPHYPYFRQVLEDFSKYRTFKSGETYRFGIQFQSDRGEWTEVLWLGDKECVARPLTKENGDVFLNNAVFDSNTNDGILFNTHIKDILKQEGLINYRLVIADPKKHNGRKIKALGVLCPTLFNYRQRMQGVYANSSWIMRPRNIKAAYHHLEPLVDYTSEGAEIVTNYDKSGYPTVTYPLQDPPSKTYVGITYITDFENNKVHVKYVEFKSDYVLNNCYNPLGFSDLEKISEYDIEDDFDLENLKNRLPEEEHTKIPSDAFKELKDKYVGDFVKSFFIGVAMVALSAISFFWGGTALAGLASYLLSSVPAVLPSILTATLITQIAVIGGHIKINDLVAISPNLSNTLIKELLGENYDKLPNYYKEFIKRGCISLALTKNSKIDNINGVPIKDKIDGIFSDTLVVYKPIYYDDKEEVVADFNASTLPLIFKPSSFDTGDEVFFQLYEKIELKGIDDIKCDNDYFVDESLLTFHSPEIDSDSILNPKYKCNIIGYVPLEGNNYFDAKIEISPAPHGEDGGINKDILYYRNNSIYEYNPFYSGELYLDLSPNNPLLYCNYWCYLYGPGDITGKVLGETDADNTLETITPKVVKKQILNHSYSINSVYFNLQNMLSYDANTYMFNDSSFYLHDLDSLPFATNLYEGNHSNAYVVKGMKHITNTEEDGYTTSDEMITITSNSTPHAVIHFDGDGINKTRLPLLPTIGRNDDDRYLSIKDGRVPELSSWTHNIFSDDRGLLWNYYFNNIVDNFSHIKHPYFDISCSGKPVLNEAIDDFEKSNTWKIYAQTKNAIGVLFLTSYSTESSNYKVSTWLNPDTFISDTNSYKLASRRNKLLPYYYYNYWFTDGISEMPYFCDTGNFVLYILTEMLGKDLYGGYHNINHFYFLLGLLFGYNSTKHIYNKVDANGVVSSLHFIVPQCVEPGYQQKYDDVIQLFRDAFKKLFLFVSLYKQCPRDYKKYVMNSIEEVYSELLEIFATILSIYNIDLEEYQRKHKLYLQGDITSKELADYYATISFMVIKNSDGSLYNSNENEEHLAYSQLASVTYNEDYEITKQYNNAEALKLILTKIKLGVNNYITDSFGVITNKQSVVYSFDYSCENIYSFDTIDSEITLVSGYDNSKGYLKYNEGIYYYDGKMLKKASASDLDLYYQDLIDLDRPEKPYLMLAELYTDIPYNVLYGGHTKEAIKNLTWYPISETYSIIDDSKIDITYGDTVYQRYDCLKTYPSTEEDLNQNVDITSFMVESHINLDDRVDLNRGKFNIMTRPQNFNLFNPVYNSNNDLLLYNSLTSELVVDEYPNLFVWTLSKNYLGSVDTWTNASFLALNQCKHPITKLCTFRDKIISFNTKSIEFIDFNAKSFVLSNTGFIELQNNNKVTGTISISDSLGTNNSSIQITEKGVYYVDTNEGSVIRINQDGSILRIGVGKMNSWLKSNIVQYNHSFNNLYGTHLEYDSINKEIHIINKDHCLVYNEYLEEFTSFLDLQETVFMFAFNNKLWSIGFLNNGHLFEMYSGDYNTDYNGNIVGYSVHYRINPEIDTDKVFTNIDFVADMGVNSINATKNTEQPFDYIRAWNEYQDTGDLPLQFKHNYVSNLKLKFRTWRADIPRDLNSLYKRDRIRNPWIHLCLSKKFDKGYSNSKMEMHALNILYMS